MKRARSLAAIFVATALLAGAWITGSSGSAQASFPGKTGRIAFDDFYTGQLYAVNPDGTALVQLTHEPNGYVATWPDWSPDGSHLLFVRFNLSNGMGRIWIMRSDGSGQHKLTSDTPGYRDYQPNFTPDGRQIVFPRCKPNDGVCAIWIMRSDGTNKRALTPYKEGAREAVDFFPSVSPDGTRVAYTAFGQNGISVQTRVMRLNGTHNHAISPPALEASVPDWSPDGKRLTVSSNWARLNNNVYTMRPDGDDIDQLTFTKYPNNSGGSVYAPGGDRIAFSSDRRYPDLCCLDLFVMNANGTNQHLVPTGLQGVVDEVWGTAPLLSRTPSMIAGPPRAAHSPGAARNAPCLRLPDIVARAMC